MNQIVQRLNWKWRHRLFAEWWTLGFTASSLDEVVRSGELGTIHWLESERSRNILADPFPWPQTQNILCEEAPIFGGHGRIISLIKTPNGLKRSAVILEDEYHHSYPCTFHHEDVSYVIPETAQNDTILYRLAIDGKLTVESIIAKKRRLVDSTIFQHDKLFWIACTDLDIGADDNLCLFYAKNLSGPWNQHSLVPVKIDVSSSRPAGSIFKIDNTLYRPAQDCSVTYGGGITLHRIDVLTPEEYEETLVRRLYPDPNGPFPHGLHTLTSDGNFTWVDGKRFVLHWPTLFARIKRKLRFKP